MFYISSYVAGCEGHQTGAGGEDGRRERARCGGTIDGSGGRTDCYSGGEAMANVETTTAAEALKEQKETDETDKEDEELMSTAWDLKKLEGNTELYDSGGNSKPLHMGSRMCSDKTAPSVPCTYCVRRASIP